MNTPKQNWILAVDYHEYPSGKKVIKAITGNDVIFSDIDGKLFRIKENQILKEYMLWL